ncbi:MAG: RiPP maturation radical SAM C-methyltransferase, partial [Synergistaceae bacterium]|nr:RiPP maturation radical SAM C-methyltransferase [Synergistaceae bacterium]
DESFPDFCRAFLAGEKIGGAEGWNRPEVLTPHDRRPEGTFREPGRGTVADISGLPIPFFDDYFEALGKSGVRDKIIPGLMVETSRGCWWGAKKPCAFCGLNGMSRKHRVKNPDRAWREITELAKRHGMTSMQMGDNIIDPAHIEQLLPRFEGKGMYFMYEAPATLSREQMRKLSNAGVRRMQPGIEQLHDESLTALGKQNRVFHNIRFLKWAREYGIDLTWNCLYGFPGENDAWHDEAANLVPLLTHLQPPIGGVRVSYYRFSPYFNEPDRYGLTLRPTRPYRHIYPLSEEALSRMAYFFEDVPVTEEQSEQGKQKPGLERLIRGLYEWKKLFPPVFAEDRREPPVLAMTWNALGDAALGVLTIEDTRPIAVAPRFSFGGVEAAVYAAADQGRTAAEIARALSRDFPGASNLANVPNLSNLPKMLPRDVENILQGFVEARLMVKLGEIYLALAAAAPFRGYLPEERTPGGWYRRKHREAGG